jgi:hypothetical protein
MKGCYYLVFGAKQILHDFPMVLMAMLTRFDKDRLQFKREYRWLDIHPDSIGEPASDSISHSIKSYVHNFCLKIFSSLQASSKDSSGKWCDYHETDTHSTNECDVLKKLKVSKGGIPAKKLWKNKSNYAKDRDKKELNALKKRKNAKNYHFLLLP